MWPERNNKKYLGQNFSPKAMDDSNNDENGIDDDMSELLEDIVSVSDVEGGLLSDEEDHLHLMPSRVMPSSFQQTNQVAGSSVFSRTNIIPSMSLMFQTRKFENHMHRYQEDEMALQLPFGMSFPSQQTTATNADIPATSQSASAFMASQTQFLGLPNATQSTPLFSIPPQMLGNSHPLGNNQFPINLDAIPVKLTALTGLKRPNATPIQFPHERMEKIGEIEPFASKTKYKSSASKSKENSISGHCLPVLDRPVRVELPQLKRFLRALKRSRISMRKIQDWDKKMGLKRCHSRTMTKSCISRKKLYNAMQEIRAQIKRKNNGEIVRTPAA